MTPDERAMIDFVLRWALFSDGDDDIFPEFGITPAVFYRRVLALATTLVDEIDAATRSMLCDICTSKLVGSDGRTRPTHRR